MLTITRSGRRMDLAHPRPEDVDIVDIAFALAHTARWAGQTPTHWSVAAHCLACSMVVPTAFRLHALLHDAAEAYIGDIIRPVRHLVPDIDVIEHRVLTAVYARYSIPLPTPEEEDAVEYADHAVRAAEAARFWSDPSIAEAPEGVRPAAYPAAIHTLTIPQAAVGYLLRFVRLTGLNWSDLHLTDRALRGMYASVSEALVAAQVVPLILSTSRTPTSED